MLDWLTNFSAKTDHPMHSVEEAERLLTGLADEPHKALEEISSWLTTIIQAGGIRSEIRIAVIRLLDETGQPFETEANRLYLVAPEPSDFERTQLWQASLQFWEFAARAYLFCIDEIRRDPKFMRAHAELSTLLIVRALRALGGQSRLLYLRYLPIPPALWKSMFVLYRLCEDESLDNQRVTAYDGETSVTTPRCELLRALLLEAAHTDSMLPVQIELVARIAALHADVCLFKSAPAAGCNWAVDLAQPLPPEHAAAPPLPSLTLRYFGAGAALNKINEIINRLSKDTNAREQRFGEEFSSLEKLAVLRRLTVYWGDNPPYRAHARKQVKTEVLVTRGFDATCAQLLHTKYRRWGELILSMDADLLAALGISSDPATAPPPERWMQHDQSDRGMALEIPRAVETQIKIGALMTLRNESGACMIGKVRRLFLDSDRRSYAGIEVIARNAQKVLLRRVGQSGMRITDWTKASAASEHDYLNALYLEGVALQRPQILLAHGAFSAGAIYEAMIGEDKQHLQVEELIEQGQDCDRAAIKWLSGAA